ncbi:MAG: hypothetical protein V7L14_24200 [Nostoc sp.]|uniref:hypothetical protein n=1 Tax=Nostoc sp. TaxID=1180 RepID=UPI002FF6A83E
MVSITNYAIASDADVVVCPQVALPADGELKAIALIDGCLLKLLDLTITKIYLRYFLSNCCKNFATPQREDC